MECACAHTPQIADRNRYARAFPAPRHRIYGENSKLRVDFSVFAALNVVKITIITAGFSDALTRWSPARSVFCEFDFIISHTLAHSARARVRQHNNKRLIQPVNARAQIA